MEFGTALGIEAAPGCRRVIESGFINITTLRRNDSDDIRFGRSFFKDERDIEDFVQDVFIKVYLNLATFKGESMFSTWLIRIAYTTAINSVKRRKEYYQLEDETLLPDTKSCSPEEIEIRKNAKKHTVCEHKLIHDIVRSMCSKTTTDFFSTTD